MSLFVFHTFELKVYDLFNMKDRFKKMKSVYVIISQFCMNIITNIFFHH